MPGNRHSYRDVPSTQSFDKAQDPEPVEGEPVGETEKGKRGRGEEGKSLQSAIRNPKSEIHSQGEACDIPLPGEEAAEASTKSVTLGITGMHCASCTANTEKALKKLDGVQSASVNIATESATVKFDPAKVSTAEMEKAVTDLGYTPHLREAPGQSFTIGITGMHCASCAATIENALSKLDGVSEANVNFAAESVMVRFDPSTVSHQDMEKAIVDAGYTPHIREERTGGHLELKVVGMDNPHCLGTVKGALNSLKGITSKELFINERARIDRSGQGRIVRRGDAGTRRRGEKAGTSRWRPFDKLRTG